MCVCMCTYIHIYNEIGRRALSSLRPGSSWARARVLGRPRPSLATDLGALAGSIGPNRMALIDLAGFVRQKSTEKVAKATVKAILDRFCVDFR